MAIEDVSQAEVVSPILRAKGLHTLLGTPLVLDGRGIGVVHVGSLSPRRFTPDDARLLELVADRIATAIGRARLFGAEQRARHDAETAEGRFRLLVDGVRDYAFYMLDRAGRVESWNAGAERLEGYSADEIVGQHVSRFYLPEEARQGGPAPHPRAGGDGGPRGRRGLAAAQGREPVLGGGSHHGRARSRRAGSWATPSSRTTSPSAAGTPRSAPGSSSR